MLGEFGQIVALFARLRGLAQHAFAVTDQDELMAGARQGDVETIRIADEAAPAGESEGDEDHVGFSTLAAIHGQVLDVLGCGHPVVLSQLLDGLPDEFKLGFVEADDRDARLRMLLRGLEDIAADDEGFGRIGLLPAAVVARLIRRGRHVHPNAAVSKQVGQRPGAF